MNEQGCVLLIGQALLDVCYYRGQDEPGMRLGGVFHAARALWAMKCPYCLAYVAPDYLDEDIQEYAGHIGCVQAQRIGTVTRCPNVVIVGEPREIGSQGYEFIYRDVQQCSLDASGLKAIVTDHAVTDVLVFPGGFDLSGVLQELADTDASVFADVNFEPKDPKELAVLGRPLESAIISTSSHAFKERGDEQPQAYCDEVLGTLARFILLKENRGGSRLFSSDNSMPVVSTPAQPRKVKHSVGVGDCFDAVFVAQRRRTSERAAMAYASYIAAEYAVTTDIDDFGEATDAALAISPDEIVELEGIVMPWEERSEIHIYIAGPDFEEVDTRPIDQVADALKYHNFVPRLPIRENGQMGVGASKERKRLLCNADLKMMDECQILLAVLLYDDPGTLIEIGLAVERKLPVIVYDPYDRAENLMLTELPTLLSSDLDEVVTAVFAQSARLVKK